MAVVVDQKTKLNQIIDVLGQLSEDTSVPRNIRRGATDAKIRLEKSGDPLDVRISGALGKLDELANDPNAPRGIQVLNQHPELFAGKVVKLFVTLDEIRANIDILRQARTQLFCTVADAAEGRAAVALVRSELSVY